MVRRLDAAQRRIVRTRLINRDGKMCKYCHRPLLESEMTIDHITPIWKNGRNKQNNLQILCFPCHQHKSKHEHPYCILQFMYHVWARQISTYRHRKWLRKLIRHV